MVATSTVQVATATMLILLWYTKQHLFYATIQPWRLSWWNMYTASTLFHLMGCYVVHANLNSADLNCAAFLYVLHEYICRRVECISHIYLYFISIMIASLFVPSAFAFRLVWFTSICTRFWYMYVCIFHVLQPISMNRMKCVCVLFIDCRTAQTWTK